MAIGRANPCHAARPGEYIWAKFMAVLAGCALIVVIQLASMLFFNHVLPNSEAHEMRGPLHAFNYLIPTLLFAVPTIVFLAGLSFAAGEWSRRPILVFVLPVAIVLVDGFFLWDWSPNWLDPRINDLMMWIDPSGFRWLNETWLKVDRGVSFYNNEPIPLDRGFLISRVVLVVLGFLAVMLTRFHFAATLRGATSRRTARLAALQRAEEASVTTAQSPSSGLAGHDRGPARIARGGLAGGTRRTDRAASSPGLYFSPAPRVADARPGAHRGRFPGHAPPDHIRDVRRQHDGCSDGVPLLAPLVLHG